MSEADTPKPSSFSGNDPEPIDELLATEDNTDAGEILDELLASLEPSDAESVETDSDLNLDDFLMSEATEATSSEEFPDSNHFLLRRNAELQKALEAAQTEIEQQQWRLREAEDLNAQQNEEINAASEQNLSLSQELKRYRQQEQHQAEKMTQLTHQLEASQQRVAQLERECALIQQQLHEQSYQLSQAEKYSRDLSFRLQQQRRHTWQFKSALNKCLETNGEPDLVPNATTSSEPIPAWSSHNNPLSLSQQGTLKVSWHQQADTAEETHASSEEEMSDAVTAEREPFDTDKSFSKEETRDRYSPAPLLTSTRKKRQSYAAVELPQFFR